ncbi:MULTISPECIES: PIN domain-containing protein [unclassified Rhodococcus (in: high G+C Gram-positive bacteria)]|uniref:PIN domain-containing protein n=1 Tax=unclassified Rhodococcus (in: high G+C Gram-positive bacteria) TaxID=192944 RepID=UPI0012F6B535|nr:PIN domain-containing protein [Rhodococcus sp. DK17]
MVLRNRLPVRRRIHPDTSSPFGTESQHWIVWWYLATVELPTIHRQELWQIGHFTQMSSKSSTGGVMFVVLDTNILLQDKNLTSAKFETILAASESSHVQLVVPQIILDEYVNKFRESLPKAYQDYVKALRSYRSHLPAPHQPDLTYANPDFDDLTKTHKDSFVDRLLRANARVIPYPQVTHEDVTRRALARRRPFTKEGQVGYRDVLIWESILELARQGRTFFVTNDGGFFESQEGTPKLHPDLIDDLKASKLPTETIVIYRNTETFVKDQIESVEDIRTRLQADLLRDGIFRTDFRNLLADLLVSESAISADNSQFDLPAGGSVTAARPIKAYDMHHVEVMGAKRIDADSYFITIEAEIDVDVDIDIDYDDREYEGDELYGGSHTEYTAETITATCDLEARYQDGQIVDAILIYAG